MFYSFILSLCSNTLTLESIFEYIRQKLIKNMLILKFHPRMKYLQVFFSFFHPGMKYHPCLSSRDEISSRQKRVNSKRHFTIDHRQGWFHPGTSFIPGWNFTCKHPLRMWNFKGTVFIWTRTYSKTFKSALNIQVKLNAHST